MPATIGPLRVLQQTSPVNYRVIPVNGRRLPYIVHVERLKRFISREETEESKRLPSLASTIEADAAVETLPFVFNENKGPITSPQLLKSHASVVSSPDENTQSLRHPIINDLKKDPLPVLRRSTRERKQPERFGYINK